ncbi:hypothetical protein D3C73_1465330 [compost metagenome]
MFLLPGARGGVESCGVAGAMMSRAKRQHPGVSGTLRHPSARAHMVNFTRARPQACIATCNTAQGSDVGEMLLISLGLAHAAALP